MEERMEALENLEGRIKAFENMEKRIEAIENMEERFEALERKLATCTMADQTEDIGTNRGLSTMANFESTLKSWVKSAIKPVKNDVKDLKTALNTTNNLALENQETLNAKVIFQVKNLERMRKLRSFLLLIKLRSILGMVLMVLRLTGAIPAVKPLL